MKVTVRDADLKIIAIYNHVREVKERGLVWEFTSREGSLGLIERKTGWRTDLYKIQLEPEGEEG